MTTLETITSYLHNNHLVCVDEKNALKSVSLLSLLSRRIKSIFIGTETAFADCKSEKIAFAVQQFIKHQKLSPTHSWAVIDFLRLMEKRVKKIDNRTRLQAVADEAAHRVLAPKRVLVDQAINYLLTNPEQSEAYRDALAFLEKSKKRISRALRTPLPFWFHATSSEAAVSSILQSGTIKQHLAARGFGAYVSSSDEAGQVIGYGRFTFSLDKEFIEENPASFFVPNPEDTLTGWMFNRVAGWKCPSIWVRVESDIPVTHQSISYIAYPREERATHRPLRQAIKHTHPWVWFIKRDASQKICEVFRKVTLRDIPPHWRWLKEVAKVPVPTHFREPLVANKKNISMLQ